MSAVNKFSSIASQNHMQFFAGLRTFGGDLRRRNLRCLVIRFALKPQVAKLLTCNPRKDALLKDGNKSDRVDARKLEELLRGNQLKPVCHGETCVRSCGNYPGLTSPSSGLV
jgi:hypothetical protein